MSKSDVLIFVFTSLGGASVFIITIVMLALKGKDYFDVKFTLLHDADAADRKLMYEMFDKRDRAIRRLEFWAIRRSYDGSAVYQPGIDPPELAEADRLEKS